ncbi:S41 family peptidase [Phocaeicola sp.]|uniref:S41 family peptidase n=1 Tax=Phocaeicola sp. TaxID=2773926 RepID=UPI003A94BCE0
MKKHISHLIYGWLALMGLLSSCGEDRSGEYYALIATKTWIYEVMQENYLFYEDIPAEEKLDFFKKPAEFLTSAASSKDQKNGYVFSHVDSVLTTSRATSTYPCFGFEAALVRTESRTNALRVLYTQPSSPAAEAGLKRGDWIIAVDNKKISTNDYSTYITRPTKAYSFTLGKYNPYPDEVNDPEFNYVEFDTLGVIQMPEPRYVEEQDVLKYDIISSNSRKAFYLLYNEFDENTDVLKEILSQISGQQFDDIILDLRYNPGGYVNTAHKLCSALAPATAIGQPFLHMIYNDKINKTETLNFESSSLTGGTSLSYQNLYVLTSENTASASEIVINCLKPYMEGHLYQVGTATYGKNVAQQLFTNPEAPGIELWLTTTYLSNSQGYYDYFKNGLLPDFEIEENYGGELGDFGTAEDLLMQPVLYKMANGSFPVVTNPDESENATTSGRSLTSKQIQLLINPIAQKPHYNRIRK